jgi:hypothetical protein
VEWEDVLLRVELMTRALRNAAEELGPGGGVPELERMIARETAVAGWLEGHAVGARAEPLTGDGTNRAANRDGSTIWAGAGDLVDRLVSMRARNFAMVQRRGLGVWDWRAPMGGEEVTSYQLLSWLVREDVRSLAALRAAGRGEAAPAC